MNDPTLVRIDSQRIELCTELHDMGLNEYAEQLAAYKAAELFPVLVVWLMPFFNRPDEYLKDLDLLFNSVGEAAYLTAGEKQHYGLLVQKNAARLLSHLIKIKKIIADDLDN